MVPEFLKMNEIVAHRGPDGYGLAYYQTTSSDARLVDLAFDQIKDLQGNATLALGHRRLAIIDLSQNGAQPMSSADSNLWITFNGEIYNYIELREELKKLGYQFRSESDTEVILAAYSEWGTECVHHFNGIWAFAIADLRNRKLFCSRDRFGVKPFHYFHDGTHFVFGSEIKQLLCFPFVPRQINQRAVYEYLAFSAVDYAEETFFSSIYKLMQGHNLIVDLRDGTIENIRYYQPVLEKNTKISYLEAGQEFYRLLKDSVRLQLRSDVEVGSCLSGGLDSSSIVSLMRDELARAGKTQIQRTFSSHFEEEEANELEYMQEVIAATGVHADFIYPTPDDLLTDLERMIWHQEEPFGSTSIFAQWSVFKLVNRNHVKVMLDGQGADEMLAGYVGLIPIYLNQLMIRQQYVTFLREFFQYARLHEKWKMTLLSKKALDIMAKFGLKIQPSSFNCRSDWINPAFSQTYQAQSLYLKTLQITPFGEKEHLENTLYQMTFINNLQALLRHEDRNSMAFSVEARVPFLDHRLVEYVFSLPSKFKIRDGYTKRVLRDGMKSVIPENVRWRVKKLGFATPEEKWQKTALNSLIKAAIQDERIRAYIEVDKAANYFAQLQQQTITDFAPWRWLNLSLWMKTYDLG